MRRKSSLGIILTLFSLSRLLRPRSSRAVSEYTAAAAAAAAAEGPGRAVVSNERTTGLFLVGSQYASYCRRNLLSCGVYSRHLFQVGSRLGGDEAGGEAGLHPCGRLCFPSAWLENTPFGS